MSNIIMLIFFFSFTIFYVKDGMLFLHGSYERTNEWKFDTKLQRPQNVLKDERTNDIDIPCTPPMGRRIRLTDHTI